MSLSVVEIVLLLTVGGWLLLRHFGNRYEDSRRRRSAMDYVLLLRRLLEHLPQHRGMANALLRGDASFRDKLQAMQATVSRDLREIERHPSHSDTARWRRIKADWETLSAGVASLEPQQSFARHTQLIAQAIFLLDDVDKAHDLAVDLRDGAGDLLMAAIGRLPRLMEAVGQARGIGSGAAAEGRTTTATRVKLLYLDDQIGTVAQATFQGLEAALRGGRGVQGGLGPDAVGQSRKLVDEFRAMLQNELLGRERIRIAAGDYFAGGTRVIEDGLGLFDAMVALAIGQAGRLELQRRASYRQAWGFFLAFAAASIGAGLSLGAA